ncbi:hypothetical protein BDN72DRAFT_837588, partial [Pluteus cervinus]
MRDGYSTFNSWRWHSRSLDGLTSRSDQRSCIEYAFDLEHLTRRLIYPAVPRVSRLGRLTDRVLGSLLVDFSPPLVFTSSSWKEPHSSNGNRTLGVPTPTTRFRPQSFPYLHPRLGERLLSMALPYLLFGRFLSPAFKVYGLDIPLIKSNRCFVWAASTAS